MNKQALSLAVFIAGAYPAASSALGLGDIESSSHLNQPLRAKIELLSGVPADASQIKVRLASPDVFNRVGVARPEFLDSLQFTPTLQNGKPVILVTSNSPIQEPFVNFLLEVSWPQGQLLKEYTVMLDPPVLMQPGNTVTGEASVRAEPKASGTVRRQVQNNSDSGQNTNAQNNSVAAPTDAVQAPRQSSNRTYVVKPGDTLFRVASRLQRQGVSNDQMMMALFRANPNAFIDNNLNNLRSGVTLKAPSNAEVGKVSRAEARRQIRQHNADWRELRQSLAKNTVPQKAVTANNKAPSTASGSKKDQARLEVLGTKSGSSVNKDSAVAASNAKLTDLEKQLSLARESLTARQKENDELKSRVGDLESMLSKKNRLIALRNDQLAGLQKQLTDNGITVPPLAEMNEAGDIIPGKAITPATATNKTVTPVAPTPNTAQVKPADQGKDLQTHMANVNGQGGNEVLRADNPDTTATTPATNNAVKPVTPAPVTPPVNTVAPKPVTPAPVVPPASSTTTPATPNTPNPTSANANNPAGTETTTTPATPIPPASLIKPTTTPTPKPAVIPVAPLAGDEPKKPAPVFADQNKDDGDFLELLTSPLALQIGAGSLALLLLLWLLSRRRKPDEGKPNKAVRTEVSDEDFGMNANDLDDDFDLRSLEDELNKAEARDTKRPEQADPFGLDDDFDNAWNSAPAKTDTAPNAGKDATAKQQNMTSAIADQPTDSSKSAWDLDTHEEDDLLTEANVYIAYGLYQQAESELKKGIERQPEKLEYRHKLLECYFVSNNREAFDRQAEQFAQLNGKGKEELWKAVQEWGRKISPDNLLYQAGGNAAAPAKTDASAATFAAASIGGAAATALAAAAFTGVAHADDEAAASTSESVSDDEFDFNLDELEGLTLTEFDTTGETDHTVETVLGKPPETAPTTETQLPDTNDTALADDFGGLDFDDIDLDKLLADDDDAGDHSPSSSAQTLLDNAVELPTAIQTTEPVVDQLDEKLAGEFDDFDFDLALDDEPLVSAPTQLPEPEVAPAMAAAQPQADDELLDFDFDVDFAQPEAKVEPVVASPVTQTGTAEEEQDDELLDFMLDDAPVLATKPEVANPPAETKDAFDFDDLDDLFADDDGDVGTVAAPAVAKAVETAPTKSAHVANLNLHLDNTSGINRILPKDTFYAPTNGEDQDWLGDIDDALSFLDFPDEEIDLHEAHISTKLDLARAYLDMGDIEGARSTLEEVMVEGNDDQRREAEVLLHQTG